MNNKIVKLIKWTPRILATAYMLFLAMFSLDVFGSNTSIWQIVIGFFMHNIPSLILLLALSVSWKNEFVGGILFIAFGLLLFVGMGFKGYEGILFIIGPFTIIGLLFLFAGLKNRLNNKNI